MSRLSPFALFASIAVCGLTSVAARADTVIFTLDSPMQTIAPGGTASFSGTITAPSTNTQDVYVEGQSITFGDPQGATITDDLFANFDEVFTPGMSEDGVLFEISVPMYEMPGVYSGFDVLQGGATSDSQDMLGTAQPFTLTVAASAPTSVTPEPPAYLLFATGSIGLLAYEAQRRRKLL